MLIAVTVGLLATRLRQPLIVAFIAVGILVGPPGLGIVEHSAAMELLAEFGIAILLFVVGLKLDLNLIRALGPVAVATGIGQITFTEIRRKAPVFRHGEVQKPPVKWVLMY